MWTPEQRAGAPLVPPFCRASSQPANAPLSCSLQPECPGTAGQIRIDPLGLLVSLHAPHHTPMWFNADHCLLPVKHGGRTAPANLVALQWHANATKSDRCGARAGSGAATLVASAWCATPIPPGRLLATHHALRCTHRSLLDPWLHRPLLLAELGQQPGKYVTEGQLERPEGLRAALTKQVGGVAAARS